MFENLGNFFKKMVKSENKELGSKDDAKERLHLVLMQDRANVSADFLELMKQEIIEVIKKYIVVDEASIDVRLTNKTNEDGTTGAPALYANIPIVNIKNDMKAQKVNEIKEVEQNRIEKEKNLKNEEKTEDKLEVKSEEIKEELVENKPEEKDESQKQEKTSENADDKNENVNENKIDENESKNENLENEKKVEKNNKNLNKNTKKSGKQTNNSKKNEEQNIEEDDGKDVTFDELLKAAEEDLKKSEDNKK